MITSLIAKIIGTSNDRHIKKLKAIVVLINDFEPKINLLTDEQLSEKTVEFRKQLASGKTLDEILPEAFAVVRETSKRIIGQRHYDVQLMGGIILHQGKISEMKTGEGKTLTATLALYLNALSGSTAYLVTVNDYLARRDAQWMSPIYQHLGLTVGVLQNSMTDKDRKKVYSSDILYATNNELGFDYLRDNMKFRLADYVQKDMKFAIIDEVDSILIDEARTPLIISGSTDEIGELYIKADQAVRRLKKGIDYEIDEKQRTALLTESGNDEIERFFKLENLYSIENVHIVHHISQALRAHTMFHNDVEYVVQDGEIMIVDEFTGRILPSRRYSDGLHQALEVKEGVELQSESQTLASITLQNFFRLFKKLAGMTGTAMTEAEEFHNIYKLDVISIPTNRQMIRIDKTDLIFLNEKGKFNAIISDIKERQIKGQPVLIGTIAIEKSEKLSKALSDNNIEHEVLNAKQHEREAYIIENAGQLSKVTIATNMAGRGTDIKLSVEAIQAGGLYILGTERHESRRIDNQLRGRSGRQGDPGESRFYISLEDDLVRIFAGDELRDTMQKHGMTDDEVIESSFISKRIEYAQERVEKDHFSERKRVLEYDDVMNQHRKVIYQFRKNILEGAEKTSDLIYEMIETFVVRSSQNFFEQEDRNRESFINSISMISGVSLELFENQEFNYSNQDSLTDSVSNFLCEQYSINKIKDERIAKIHDQAQSWLILEIIDQAWKQHMLNLDHLREGIGLRGWGKKNPLIEYKREAFIMFKDMLDSVSQEIVKRIFTLKADHFNIDELEEKREAELEAIQMISSFDTTDGQAQANAIEKHGRNEPCPCSSGKKYKKCCGN